MKTPASRSLATLSVAVLLAGCATPPAPNAAAYRAQRVAAPIRYELDGATDDLLTAGLGVAGLRGAPPAFADPLRPSARELRRRAIYMNYRGLVDVSAASGFGTDHGLVGDPRLGGVEILVGLDSPDTGPSTAMLQIPRSFDAAHPCLIAVASSGSRGIYGALPTVGTWGLLRGCAVVHTDKGTGSGAFDVAGARGLRLDGTIAAAGDPLLSFSPDPSGVAKLRAQRPHAVLFRHANSGRNVEAHWGAYLLQAIDVAFELLNGEYPRRATPFRPANTEVIAAGISNGGGAVLHALEIDTAGWIDGAVVSEPNISVRSDAAHTTYDLVVAQLLLQPCALLADDDRTAPYLAATVAAKPALEQWCRELGARGELAEGEPAVQAREARDRLLALGILPEALRLGHVNVHASLWAAIGVTYASAFARMAPDELPCGVSFAASDITGKPRALTDEEFARLFADSSGIAPTAGVNLIAPGADGALHAANFGSIDLALCLRGLRERLAPGILAAAVSPRADSRPLIIMHGRGDGLIAVNHSSRPYYREKHAAGGDPSGARYYEIERGQHFDALLTLPGFAGHYVAMLPLFEQGMDLMDARLRDGAALPPSQVVRGRILAQPGADAIMSDGARLDIPR